MDAGAVMVVSSEARIERVGIVGGGQLAWMMADGAKQLGLELIVQTPSLSDPAGAIAHKVVLGAVSEAAVTAELADSCDVITFENEFIDLAALSQLAEEKGTRFYPQLECLRPLLDKYDQRQYCDRMNLPVPAFATLEQQADAPQLAEKVNSVGLPLALKTRRHGYDGQGTFILYELEAVQSTWQQLGYQPVLLEAFVPFAKELAVMVARDRAGEIAVYPVVETQQVDQVCRRVIAPARVAPSVQDQVSAIAIRLVTQLGVVGVLGIELFLTESGHVLINEIAPRTHNSGHYTLDVCETSQFEQQLRAVCGLPLGSVSLSYPGAVMVNLLGFETADCSATQGYADRRAALEAIPQAHLYWYGKKQARVGRKMGHVTVLTDSANDDVAIVQLLERIEACWYGS
ncbi:MAG: 5-(carboxyamino)imidazole ribonucleotide synthase [Cyanobacteria bacterium J06627_32]